VKKVQGYSIETRLPSIEEYRSLCTAVGWADVMNFEAAEVALPRSLMGVVVMRGPEAVGMGRIVGDEAIYFYLQDIAVAPEHQGKGLGKAIVAALLDYVRRSAPEKAFVGLFATPEGKGLYERFGFAQYEQMGGMFQTTPLAETNQGQ
jgi:GNAT superfamily N-acetyltransferase